jgi:BASS family bile acid:Na+ symporter
MMLTALVLVLGLGGLPSGFPVSNGDIAMVALILMMTLALSSIQLKTLKLKLYVKDVRNAFVLSFVLLTAVTLVIAYLFSGELRAGWILLAAVPSAVSVVSFTCLWGGDTESSAVSSIVIYLASLVVTPVITFVFLGRAVNVLTLLYYLSLQIVLPLVLSRLVKRFLTSTQTRNILINICFFILVIAVMGANRSLLFSAGTVVAALAVLAVVRVFGVGIAYNRFIDKQGVKHASAVSEVLFSTYKNTGMAASLALVLLGPQGALPAAVCMVVDVVWLIFAGKFLFTQKAR